MLPHCNFFFRFDCSSRAIVNKRNTSPLPPEFSYRYADEGEETKVCEKDGRYCVISRKLASTQKRSALGTFFFFRCSDGERNKKLSHRYYDRATGITLVNLLLLVAPGTFLSVTIHFRSYVHNYNRAWCA